MTRVFHQNLINIRKIYLEICKEIHYSRFVEVFKDTPGYSLQHILIPTVCGCAGRRLS